MQIDQTGLTLQSLDWLNQVNTRSDWFFDCSMYYGKAFRTKVLFLVILVEPRGPVLGFKTQIAMAILNVMPNLQNSVICEDDRTSCFQAASLRLDKMRNHRASSRIQV